MPDAGTVDDLRRAGRLGQAVVFAGHARARRDDLADFADGASGRVRQRGDGAVRLADHPDLDPADRPADASAVSVERGVAGFPEEFIGGNRGHREALRRAVRGVGDAVRRDDAQLGEKFA